MKMDIRISCLGKFVLGWFRINEMLYIRATLGFSLSFSRLLSRINSSMKAAIIDGIHVCKGPIMIQYVNGNKKEGYWQFRARYTDSLRQCKYSSGVRN